MRKGGHVVLHAEGVDQDADDWGGRDFDQKGVAAAQGGCCVCLQSLRRWVPGGIVCWEDVHAGDAGGEGEEEAGGRV